MPTLQCIQCGSEFHRCPSKIKRSPISFCSNTCHGAYKRSKRPSATCAHCGAEISRSPAHIKQARLHFCSRACHHAHRRIGYIDANGYRVFSINGKSVLEHRFVMEQHLKRKLLPTEDVHHRDHNRSNNALSNLVVLKRRAHMREHYPLSSDLERAQALRAEGYSFRRIGKELGTNYVTIWNVFIRRGLHVPQGQLPKPHPFAT